MYQKRYLKCMQIVQHEQTGKVVQHEFKKKKEKADKQEFDNERK